jgi:hypothetical protein
MAVFVGLQPGEIVLRGGGLPEPVIVSNLLESNGKSFWRLCKRDSILCRYLLGSGYSKMRSRLASRPLWATLESLRAARRQELVKQLAVCDMNEEAGAAIVDDLAADLCLDDDTSARGSTAVSKRKAGRIRKVLPAFSEIEVNCMGSSPWRVNVLMAPFRQAVAIEDTEDNLKKLYELIQKEMNMEDTASDALADIAQASEASIVAAEPLLKQQRAARPPRGPANAREYWRGDRRRWICKEKLAIQEDDTSGSPPAKRFRTVTRRPSDAVPPPLAACGNAEPLAAEAFDHLSL